MIRLALPSTTIPRTPAGVQAHLARLATMTTFGLVGLSGLAVNQFLLWALVAFTGTHYLAAAALSSVGSTTTNFLLNDLLVFHARPGTGLVVRYLAFMALTLATLPVRLPILLLLTSGLHIHYLLSNLIALLAIFVARYMVCDALIWRRRPRSARGLGDL